MKNILYCGLILLAVPSFLSKRTADAHNGFVADMKINFCGFRIAVSKQCLNIPLFHSLLHKVGGKTVTEAVRSNTG